LIIQHVFDSQICQSTICFRINIQINVHVYIPNLYGLLLNNHTLHTHIYIDDEKLLERERERKGLYVQSTQIGYIRTSKA